MQSKSKIAIGAVVAVGALAAFLVSNSGDGLNKTPNLTGKYSHKDGTKVEFLSDGTAVFGKDGSQRVWKYTIYDGFRVKLETATPVIGVEPAMCDYARTPYMFTISGCEYAMELTVDQS